MRERVCEIARLREGGRGERETNGERREKIFL